MLLARRRRFTSGGGGGGGTRDGDEDDADDDAPEREEEAAADGDPAAAAAAIDAAWLHAAAPHFAAARARLAAQRVEMHAGGASRALSACLADLRSVLAPALAEALIQGVM